jgi:hypothetical protein
MKSLSPPIFACSMPVRWILNALIRWCSHCLRRAFWRLLICVFCLHDGEEMQKKLGVKAAA